MFEVEQKYHIDDLDSLERRLNAIGAAEQPSQQHHDTYFNHPCRDFAVTKEAFRIRLVDGLPLITYKGVKLPGAIKARRELEWRLDPGDAEGQKMQQLLVLLGFAPVATVEKRRRPFHLPAGEWSKMTVVIDDVAQLGPFAEIELIADKSAGIDQARARVAKLGQHLGLERAEERSYLRMILEQKQRHEPQSNC